MKKEEYNNLNWFIKKIYNLYWRLQWCWADIKDFLFPWTTVFKKVNGSYELKDKYKKRCLK